MSSLLRIRRVIFVVLLVALALPASTSAYVGQTATNVTITGPTGTISCGPGNTFQATVFDSAGKRVTQHPVTWTIVSAPLTATDTISPPSTLTNASGVASTTITFGGPGGPRTIRATSDNAFAQIVVDPANCAAPPPVRLNVGTCASTLDLPPAGPYTSATKVQQLGRYITFRLSFGPQYAGKFVVVTRATRGVPFTGWGSWFGATGRIADSNGDVYYWFRSYTPAWISRARVHRPVGRRSRRDQPRLPGPLALTSTRGA